MIDGRCKSKHEVVCRVTSEGEVWWNAKLIAIFHRGVLSFASRLVCWLRGFGALETYKYDIFVTLCSPWWTALGVTFAM